MEEYRRRFPNPVVSHRETGKFDSVNRERTVQKMSVRDEELILDTIDDQLHISTRTLSRQSGISRSHAHHTIRLNLLHPYHAQKVQELLPQRVNFCLPSTSNINRQLDRFNLF